MTYDDVKTNIMLFIFYDPSLNRERERVACFVSVYENFSFRCVLLDLQVVKDALGDLYSFVCLY